MDRMASEEEPTVPSSQEITGGIVPVIDIPTILSDVLQARANLVVLE